MDNIQEQFYQVMTRLKANSRAASTSTQAPKDDARITEMINGVLVTRPLKKVEYISESKVKVTEPGAQPQVWSLTKDGPVLEQEQQQESKAASVRVNKVKVIVDFLNRGY